MEYAAIIIPTLNRKKHLKRCVDSLLKNREAKYTDLYISVDYPPNDKYRSGYDEVKEYVKTINGFHQVNIFFQDSNLGPGLNRQFLEAKIKEHQHDRYIFTDDDNEFSSNFLQYINWGLDTYTDNEDIYAICSKADFPFEENSSAADFMIFPAYNPYGSGHWLHKNNDCREYLIQQNIDRIYASKKLQNKLYKESPMLLNCLASDLTGDVHAMRGVKGDITYIDIWENIYCIINNKKCIIPVIGKSRNWGNDGSGIHSNTNEDENAQPGEKMDPSAIWPKHPKVCNSETTKIYRSIHQQRFMVSGKLKKSISKKFWLYRVFGKKNYQKIVRIYRRMRGIKEHKVDDVYYG